MESVPHKWVVIKIKDGTYKVLGSWYGGYLDGDVWRLNSGIKEVIEDDDFYNFVGFSGSVYKCHKERYGMSSFTSGIYRGFKTQAPEIELMPEDTKWTELEYDKI